MSRNDARGGEAPGDPNTRSHARTGAGALAIARVLHSRTARAETGVLQIEPAGEAPKRIAVRDGEVIAVDAGHDAPVTPSAQLRYLLRLRGRPEFIVGSVLSVRYAVPSFRPDVSIRQHIDAQQIAHEPVRQRIGSERVSVILPPHGSALHIEEQAVISYLREAHSVPDLLDEGARSQRWSPLRALRLLVVLDSLGILMIGGTSGAMAEALALLGLVPEASLDEIKQAYRRLARDHHPDHHPHLDAAAQRALSARFTALTDAYRLLLRSR